MSYIDPSGKLLLHMGSVLAVLNESAETPPVNVEIDLSNRCSLGCEGCHFAYTHTRGPFASLEKPSGTTNTGDLMDLQLIKRILSQLRYEGVRSIVWSGGGEPTLHPNFDEIINYCPLPQGIYTNGGHINEERARLLKEHMTWVYVSLDYADRASYQKHKKVDAFDKVIAGINRLRQAPGKATIGAGFLLWRENWRDIDRMIDCGLDAGADYVQFRPMVYYEHDKPGELAEDTGWMRRMILDLECYEGLPGVIVDVNRFQQYMEWVEHGYPVCWWSRMQTIITPDGRLWTCVNRRGMDGDALGDLNDETFSEIWKRQTAKRVDNKCRVMCRGHIPNLTLDRLAQPPEGHGLFI